MGECGKILLMSPHGGRVRQAASARVNLAGIQERSEGGRRNGKWKSPGQKFAWHAWERVSAGALGEMESGR